MAIERTVCQTWSLKAAKIMLCQQISEVEVELERQVREVMCWKVAKVQIMLRLVSCAKYFGFCSKCIDVFYILTYFFFLVDT
jgi:hypothetical protein